jgi:transcriptional regulator with XRE-family HTH domain
VPGTSSDAATTGKSEPTHEVADMPRKKSALSADQQQIDNKPPAVDDHVGVRLRHARMTRRMTLRELAEKAGCSESLLSKIENGRALPSFGTLHRIIGVLGLTMGQLFVKTDGPFGIVSRAGERQALAFHPLRTSVGVIFEQLVPSNQGSLLEGSIQTIAPGAGGDTLITHAGEEVGYVIEGTIELTVDKTTYVLNAGDSCSFRSELPHGLRNPGPNPARVIVINTPPTF